MTEPTYRIVAFAPNPWRSDWKNRQQLLSRLGARVPIIYSNGAWTLWQHRQPEWNSAPLRGRFTFEDNVWLDEAPRLLMRLPRLRPWDRLMLSLEARRLRAFSSTHGHGPLVGYAFHPDFADEAAALDADYYVYHAYDLYSRTPTWNAARARKQRWLLERAGLVVASSEVIADALLAEGARAVEVLPNGADVELFAAAGGAAPDDVAGIPRPRIGYAGTLNMKVDFPLVERLARAHQEWSFVFVGPVSGFDEVTAGAYDRCGQLDNVHFLGGKDRQDLPRYAASMDVNIMCYRTDESTWTEGIYPLKLHEYLASGRPVVSADIPSVRAFSQVVAVALTDEEWGTKLAAALRGEGAGDERMRRAVARENDWSARVAALSGFLDRLVAGGLPPIEARRGSATLRPNS